MAEIQNSSARAANASNKTVLAKKKKKSKYADYETAPDNAIYFLFDVETTGSKRNWDRITAMSFLAFNEDGQLIVVFSRKVNPGPVRISAFLTKHIHGKLIPRLTIVYVMCACCI